LAYDLDSTDIDKLPLPSIVDDNQHQEGGFQFVQPKFGPITSTDDLLQPTFFDAFEEAVRDHMNMSSGGGDNNNNNGLTAGGGGGGGGEEEQTSAARVHTGGRKRGEADATVATVATNAPTAEMVTSSGSSADVDARMEDSAAPGVPNVQGDAQPTSGHGSKNSAAFNEALPYVSSFLARGKRSECPNERTCIGHKGKIFGLAFSPCGTYLATASEDASVIIWDAATHRCLETLTGHSRDYECLRVAWAPPAWGTDVALLVPGSSKAAGDRDPILASAGADGFVKLWRKSDGKMKCFASKDHSVIADEPSGKGGGDDKNDNEEIMAEAEAEGEGYQIYALQFINRWHHSASPSSTSMDVDRPQHAILTSCNDCVYVWSLSKPPDGNSEVEFDLSAVMTFRFTHADSANGGVSFRIGDEWFETSEQGMLHSSTTEKAFGGHRNPDNMVYVFDSSYNEANGLLGVALSDGTLRLVNSRGVCVSVLSLPGCESHLTSFSWDSSGTRLVSCVATGHMVLWHVDSGDGRGQIRVECTSVLCGGHEIGRPIFGGRYIGGKDEDLLLSWGVDGKLCVWDSRSRGEIYQPIATLVGKSDYPIYAVDVAEAAEGALIGRIAIGGGNDGGFLGVPAFIYDVKQKEDDFGMVEAKENDSPAPAK